MKKTITIILIGVIVILIFNNLNLKNKNIEKEKIIKEQLEETTEDNAYILIQKHISEVQDKEQKLVSFKSVIARAITDMGIVTSENADANTMASNIKSISKKSTNFFEHYQASWTAKSTITVECGFEPSLVMCLEYYTDGYGNHCYVQIYNFENNNMRAISDGELKEDALNEWTFEKTKTSVSITNAFVATVKNVYIWVI